MSLELFAITSFVYGVWLLPVWVLVFTYVAVLLVGFIVAGVGNR